VEPAPLQPKKNRITTSSVRRLARWTAAPLLSSLQHQLLELMAATAHGWIKRLMEVGENASRECRNRLRRPFFSAHKPIEEDKMSMAGVGWSIVLVSNKIKYNNR